MIATEDQVLEYLIKALLDYAKHHIIYFFCKVSEKIKEKQKTHSLSNISLLREKVINGEIKKGDVVKCIGQFSRFGHIHVTKVFPKVLAYRSPEIQGPKAKMQFKLPYLPIGSVPPFDKHIGLGFIYRPGLKDFARFVPFNRSPFENHFIGKEAFRNFPILCPAEYLAHTENIIKFKAVVEELPYNVMAELQNITREEYNKLKEEGRNLFLNVTNPQLSKFEILADESKNIKELKGSLFCELHVEDNLTEDDVFKMLNTLVEDIAKKYFVKWNDRYVFPVTLIEIGEKQTLTKPSKLTRSERREMERKIKKGLEVCKKMGIETTMGIWFGEERELVFSFAPLFITFLYPNFFSIYLVSDIYNNYFEDIRKLDVFIKEFMRAISSHFKFAKEHLYIDFLTDFERQTVLNTELIKKVIRNNPYLKNTIEWLQTFMRNTSN